MLNVPIQTKKIKGTNAVIFIAVVLLPFIFGHFLPKSDLFLGPANIVNVFWGLIFGIGWHLIELTSLSGSSGSSIFGFIVWPIIVELVLFYLYQKMILWSNKRVIVLVLFFIASFGLNIDVQKAETPPFNSLPLFWNFYSRAG